MISLMVQTENSSELDLASPAESAMFFRWLKDLLVLVFALTSILWGGLSALTQRKFMRFLASSSVVQLGFMMCTLVSVGKLSQTIHVQGAFFYLISYALTTGGILIILAFLQRHQVSYTRLSDLVGLSHPLPFLSFFMTLFLLSLAGIPPFIGFFAKIEALRVILELASFIPLSVVYMGMILSLGYYLVIIKKIYFESCAQNAASWVNFQRVRSTSLLVVVMVIGLVVFGYLFIAELIHRPFEVAMLPKIS
jgi:NADH-quinone oxidoreductase subunit N